MYKWVDEKGVTHYSESRRPTIPRRRPRSTSSPTAPRGRRRNFDWKQKELDSRQQNVQKVQEDREREAKEAQEARQRKVLCQQAMRTVTTYQQQVPIFSINDKGERVYVEDADRAQKIEDARERMRKNCD